MKNFTLPLTAAISAAMLATSGCSPDREWQASDNTKVCVDSDGKRTTEDRCSPDGATYSGYRWYYISRGGYVPYYGGTAGGGGWQPAGSGQAYSTAPAEAPAGAVTRGGFGSMGGGEGEGGHAGGEGGHGGGGGE